MPFLFGARDIKMLRKELCKRCWNEKSEWTEYDEKYWQEGKVLCPYPYFENYEEWIRKTTEKPPKYCPYLLEHVLSKED